MSLNLNDVGENLCIIEGGKYDKMIVSVSNEDMNENDDALFKEFTSLKLQKGEKFRPYPNVHGKRDVLYISAASNAGKSTYANQYLMNYRNCYPNNPIYLFSTVDDDDSLTVSGIKKVIIDERMYEDPLEINEFKNCMCVFDDIDQIHDKDVFNAVHQLLRKMLEIGRHNFISVIVTSHMCNKGNETRTVINEAFLVTLFLGSGSSYNTYLKNYMGLSNKQIKKLYQMKSRWITVYKRYPNVVFTENQIILLSQLVGDDDK